MARSYDEYLRRGARIAAIVIDPPGQNAAMAQKLALTFPVLSDPDGARAIKPYGVWDEPGAMSKPAILVLDPAGAERYRYVGHDFVDRPLEEEALTVLDRIGAPPIDERASPVAHLDPEPGPRAIGLADLAVYLRGVRSSSLALSERLKDPWDRAEAERTMRMAERFIAAQGATRRLIEAR